MSFCRNCGAEIAENADFCVKCGVSVGSGTNFCPNCGTETTEEQVVCVKCGAGLGSGAKTRSGGKSKGNGKFVRVAEGKWIGGIFTGAEKCYGINRWIGRVAVLFIPFWPIWAIAYFVIMSQTEMVDH